MTELNMRIYASHVSGAEAVSELNERLNDYGFSINLENVESGEQCVSINFDTQTFKAKTSRRAGQKPKCLGRKYELDELKKKIARLGAEEVANAIGVSRSTLYRRMKEAENVNSNDVYF